MIAWARLLVLAENISLSRRPPKISHGSYFKIININVNKCSAKRLLMMVAYDRNTLLSRKRTVKLWMSLWLVVMVAQLKEYSLRHSNQFSKCVGADVDFMWSSKGGLKFNIIARETLVQFGSKWSLFCCVNVMSITNTKACRFAG